MNKVNALREVSQTVLFLLHLAIVIIANLFHLSLLQVLFSPAKYWLVIHVPGQSRSIFEEHDVIRISK